MPEEKLSFYINNDNKYKNLKKKNGQYNFYIKINVI